MSDLIHFSQQNNVAVLTINHPPVNALGPGVPEALRAALDTANQDTQISAIVLMGGGTTFPAGADINQLQAAAEDPESAPNLHDLLTAIENSAKPVVMAIHGVALGGGLEIAMAGHYRIAAPDAKLGAPEVNLGIIPGAEGTQRLPRLVGIAQAVELCVTGKPVTAAEALELGLIDRIAEGDLQTAAVDFAASITGQSFQKTCDREDRLGTKAEQQQAFQNGRALAAKIRPNQTAPLLVMEALEAAVSLPFAEGCRREREIAKQSLASDQARAMIHLFFAERAVAKVPGIAKDTRTYPIARIGIIGAGTMGGGIAMACANSGLQAVINDTSQESLDRGMAQVRKTYQSRVDRGRMSQQEMDVRMARIHPQLGYDGFRDVDLIVEAAVESLEIKQQIFAEIDKIAPPHCVLATNTSTLDLDAIAGATSRPEMVVGLHFFSPAYVMRLLEIVRGTKTSKEVIATALSVARKLKKVGVVVGNGFGFVGNRMMFPYMREAQFLVEEGASPQQVDRALTNFGWAMGILAVDDMGGIDLLYRVRQEHREILLPPGQRHPKIHDALYHAGRWGQKRGAGWYKYSDPRKPEPDPDVDALIQKVADEERIERRAIDDQEIVERCMFALINEGARILEDGQAARAADIDVIYATGYGFPAFRGGPMWYASTVGLKKIVTRIEELGQQFGTALWTPAPLLSKLADSGKTFADWDAERAA